MKTNHLWRAAVICFIIAGATGVMYRFATVWGFPWGLNGGYVRHAHSHLMYFGWVTPAIMTFMAAILQGQVQDHGKPPGKRPGKPAFVIKVIAATVVLGFAVFPPFLAAGYGTIPIFGRPLPVASMVSAFNMIAWYVFAGWYVATVRRVPRTTAIRLWNAALFFLLLSTMGSWGRFVIEVTKLDAPVLADTAVDFFLNAFSNGWMVVGVLALAFTDARAGSPSPSEGKTPAPWAYQLLWIAMPFASLAGTSVAEQYPAWGAIAQISAASVAAILAHFGVILWSSLEGHARRRWMPVLAFFALMIVLHLAMTYPPLRVWGDKSGLRIVYLHVLTLGVVTGGLVTAARQVWGNRVAPSPHLFGAAVLGFVVGFLALSPLWPWGSGYGRLLFAALASALPLLAMTFALRPLRYHG